MNRKLLLSLLLVSLLLTNCGQEEPSPTPRVTATPLEDSVPSVSVNIIFYNGHILTMDEELPVVQAVAIQDEFILAVGTNEEILPLAAADTQVIDLNGLTMTPGFIDSHTHRISQQGKWNFSTIEESSREWVSQGWTGLVELAVQEGHLKEMIAADAAGDLHTRINAYLTVNTFGGDPLGDWYQAYKPGQQFSPYLRIAGLKIFIDFDSGRVQLWTQNDLNQFIQQRQLEGWQVTVKAVGIQSHDLALNAYEYAMGDDLFGDYRYRIEHSVGSSDEQVTRMADLGIIASIQPCWPATIWNWEDIRNLAEEQGLNNMFQWRNYLNGGVLITASPLNPPQLNTPVGNEEYLNDSHISVMGLIYRSVTQIGLGGTPAEDWMLDRALTVNELLPMLTINGAYATFEEDVKGSLSPGKLADLVILSADPLAVESEELVDIQVVLTMVGGRIEYCAYEDEAICLPPETTTAPDFSMAVGNWVATDNDGSSMTLEVIHNSDSNYSIIMIDNEARACGDGSDGDNLLGMKAEASGNAVGFTLSLYDADAVCAETEKTITFNMEFTYDPNSDTLIDNTNVVWQR